MSEQQREPSIDPQPGELGEGRVDVRGGTELAGGRATGSGAGWGTVGTEGGGGVAGPHAGEEDATSDEDSGEERPAETGIGTEDGPGAGEIVH